LRADKIGNEKVLAAQLEREELNHEENPLSVFLYALKGPRNKETIPKKSQSLF
jgi:hypothetical protein